ncbi:phosphopantetheine-binding protein [Nonomuraea sp. NPDC050153]|uniref:phosphopantetheine-binding protein n=1 Tax=Nonomuraea sp. NPDC050153 TaxID=3364359 RepID=UPI0037ABACC5
MNDQERAAIRAYISERVDDIRIDDDENLFEGGHVNSLFAVQLVMWIERTFDVPMEGLDLDFANIQSITAIASFVERKRTSAV